MPLIKREDRNMVRETGQADEADNGEVRVRDSRIEYLHEKIAMISFCVELLCENNTQLVYSLLDLTKKVYHEKFMNWFFASFDVIQLCEECEGNWDLEER